MTTLHKTDPVGPENRDFKPRQGQKHFLFAKSHSDALPVQQLSLMITLHKTDPVGPENRDFKPRQGQKHFLFAKSHSVALPVQQPSLMTTLHKIDPVGPENRDFKPRQEQKHFLFTKRSREYWVHSDSYGKGTEESVPGWKRRQHEAGSLPHVVQRLRMSGAILPLLLYNFMTGTGTICPYFYVSGGAAELRNYFTFEILTAPFKLFVSEKKIFHSSIPFFVHSLYHYSFFLSFTPFVTSSFF
jgi:hypothetical protein